MTEVALGEFGVLLADVRQPAHHPRAAEQLRLETVALRVERHVENGRKVVRTPVLAGQQEVVHAADSGHRVAYARRHTRPEQGRDDHSGIVRHSVLALNDMYSALGPHRLIHDNFPTTASIVARSCATVNGLVM